MTVVACSCGALGHSNAPNGSSLKGVADSLPGWAFVWDISDGLRAIWTCPACTTQARELLAKLQDIYKGVLVTRLNFIPMLKTGSLL